MIGPNSVIQTLQALAELEGTERYDSIARRAELPATDLQQMIPEAWFVRLVRELRRELPWTRSEAVLRRAGEYTADYVAANRIPAFFRSLLRILPARLAVPLLLSAFSRHAWTFAGGGKFSARGAYPGVIVLDGCPTCRAGDQPAAAGAYYVAAFQGLLRLAAPAVEVREDCCQSRGASHCQFSIQIGGHSPRGEPSCASF